MKREFPEATHLSRSWVVKSPSGCLLGEIFSEDYARLLFEAGCSVVLIGDHLTSLNKKEEKK